jgi:septal ring factor EnvC (AmiA/AmiB activator)
MSMNRILTIILIAGSALYAQRAGRGVNATPPTPAQIAQRETDRLTRFFSLTEGQPATVLEILTNVETQLQALTPQIQTLRTTLTTAIKANNQSQISSTLLQLSNLQEQEAVVRANAAGQIYATVLNAAQQAQVGNGLGPLMGGGAGPGGRGPGGFGPGRGNRN